MYNHGELVRTHDSLFRLLILTLCSKDIKPYETDYENCFMFYEQRNEKPRLRSFRPGPPQTGFKATENA